MAISKRCTIKRVAVAPIVLLIIYLLRYKLQNVRRSDQKPELSDVWNTQKDVPHLVVTACGVRLEEALPMLKSAVLLTKSFLIIHVFIDTELQKEKVKMELDSWNSTVGDRLRYEIYTTSFPSIPTDVACETCKGLEWKSLLKPCAAQRLFLGDALKGVDSVLYVDADALLLAPIEEIWSIFHKFNSSQFLGVVSDTEVANTGIYHTRNIPFYGPNGINSGVLLMNLTRLRTSSWIESVTQALIKYGKSATYGDQDLINVYLHDHPESGYLLTCDWNYHPEQCISCHQADQTGIALLHSTRHAFVNNQVLPFKALHLAFKQFIVGRHANNKAELRRSKITEVRYSN